MDENTEAIETPVDNEVDEVVAESSNLDEQTMRSIISELIEEALAKIPGEGTVQPERDLDAPVTLREMERFARELVEGKMSTLRDAEKQKPKPKAKPKPSPEPEPQAAPAAKEVKDKLRSWLWGDE